MALPEVTLTIKDGALGLVPENADNVQAFVGVCSSGTANAVASYNDPQALRDALGTGPLVELACAVLARAGGPVVVVKSAAGTAGSNSAVAVTAGNTGASVLTLTGTPLDTYQAIVKVVTGGANPASGAVVFKYSLDNGATYSADIALPTSGVYAIPNAGTTLNFSAASLVANDSYTFTTVAPTYSTVELGAALDALLGSSFNFFNVNIVGFPGASGTSTLAGVVAGKMDSAAASYRYIMATMAAEDSVDATLITQQATISSTRVSVVAGFCTLVSAVSGASYRRPQAWAQAIQLALSSPKEDLGKVRKGAVPGVLSLARDEWRTPALDAVRYSTMRTHVGKQGFYFTTGKMMAPAGSDYLYIPYRRVMDIACGAARAKALEYLNDEVLLDKNTGLIVPTAANVIDTDLTEAVRLVTLGKQYVSDAQALIDRSVNILSTGRFVVKVRILPLAYARWIELELGFTNPALTRVAA